MTCYAAGMAAHRGPAHEAWTTVCPVSLEAAQRQHADLCKNTSGKAVTQHSILLGVSGTCYTEHTLNQFKQLGLDHQRANKLARKLHADSVMYTNKLFTTRRAIENKNTFCSQTMEPDASNNPPDPH
eukprot:1141964-Pelagomonas_calceolata.AAC.1